MKTYNILNRNAIDEIEKIVGKKNIITESEGFFNYNHDEFALDEIKHNPEIVVKPSTTEEVSDVMKIASREKFPVVARGGATGLVGGCVPSFGGIVISTERMNRIIEIDEANLMVTLQSGSTLRDFYSSIKSKKLLFPPHPGEESATIGGVISTNAGGTRAIKYGTIRNFTRYVEAVLADGSIITSGGKVIKDSTGYSLLHLLIGSEGTLGIITKAVLSVLPEPEDMITLIIPYKDIKTCLTGVPSILKSSVRPLAIEFIDKKVIEIAQKYTGKHWPSMQGDIFLLIILEGNKEEIEKHCEIIADICLNQGAIDVFIADSQQKQDDILYVRSMVYEALKFETIEILDVSLPPDQMATHISSVDNISAKYNVWLPTYGHAGDGNLHTHIMKITPGGDKITDWKNIFMEIRNEIIFDGIQKGGKISGEHGIGLIKKQYLEMCLGKTSIEIMKKIKQAFDPLYILNPGKIFDPD